jgi:hypothetical protein
MFENLPHTKISIYTIYGMSMACDEMGKKPHNAAVQGRNCRGTAFAYFAKGVPRQLRPAGTPC